MPQLKPIPLTMDELQLSPDDERYADGAACVRKYWAHATQLNVWQQKQMIEHIKSHSYAVEPAGSPIQSHKLYREEMLRHQMLGSVGLTPPPYLILSAVYPELPEEYVEAVKLAFGTYEIDASNKYFRMLGLKKKEQLATITIKKSSPSIQKKQPASSSLAKQRQISSASSAPGNDISASTETEPRPPTHSGCSDELSDFQKQLEVTGKDLDFLQVELDAVQAKFDSVPSRLNAAMGNPLRLTDDE